MNTAPAVKDICLVGGGHSHALVLRRWAMAPLPGVRLTLVSSSVLTPYSGMLPGLVAGHYSFDDIHIDLLRLCNWGDVRFIEDTMTGINLNTRQVLFDDRPALSFDVLSLDTGSTPDLSVPGSGQHTTPVKPVSHFYERWQTIEQRLFDGDARDHIAVVGAGAGGFELAVAMKYRLRDTAARVFWVLRGSDSIGGRPARVSSLAEQAAEKAGISVVREFDVSHVEANTLHAKDGRSLPANEILWCTGAVGPSWTRAAGLDTDSRGFVATNESLQSTSHEFVFASGDIGTQVKTPSNKAGVFAVRQAPVLFDNLRRFVLDESLRSYRPQRDFLSLMATGPKHAIANRGPVVIQGDWVWRWKDHIDQTFMDKFRNLPPRRMNASLAVVPNALRDNDETSEFGMRCRGCGAKVGEGVLQRVLSEELSASSSVSPAGDTAVVTLPTRQLVQSVDQINAIVDDPYVFGRIAALHSLSDVVTLQANLHSAQVMLTLPQASELLIERDLRLVMSGIVKELAQYSCAVIGGHTSQGNELSLGLVINASLPSDAEADISQLNNISAGDVLVLTKPLGVGTLFAGHMKNVTAGRDILAAQHSMLQSNYPAASILRSHGGVAMTDVTGFGLLGHLNRLLQGIPSGAGASIGLERVPLLQGALQLSQQSIRSTMWNQNRLVFSHAQIDDTCDEAALALLVDPQTSGGLLSIVPQQAVSACLSELLAAGYMHASAIGIIDQQNQIRINPSLELP